MSKRLTASVLSALAIAAPTHAEESTGLPITVTATRFTRNTASATFTYLQESVKSKHLNHSALLR